MNRRLESVLMALFLVALIGGLAWQNFGGSASEGNNRSESDREVVVADNAVADNSGSASADSSGDDSAEGFATEVIYDRTIDVDALPDEAIDTLWLIDSDGPYPFGKDGSTFQNREGELPDHPVGYYREFTVITPGSDDRGARRIVSGSNGELFYTSDHYESFSQITGW